MINTKGKQPERKTLNSMCYDIYCNEDQTFPANEWTVIRTGLFLDGTERMMLGNIEIPQWGLEIMPRSSAGHNYKVRFSNTVSQIDQDYRGEIWIEINPEITFSVKRDTDRIAQFKIVPYLTMKDEIVPVAVRGEGGQGSTGGTGNTP